MCVCVSVCACDIARREGKTVRHAHTQHTHMVKEVVAGEAMGEGEEVFGTTLDSLLTDHQQEEEEEGGMVSLAPSTQDLEERGIIIIHSFTVYDTTHQISVLLYVMYTATVSE